MPFWLILAAYTSSGVAGLVYEVSWSRMLTLAMGHGLPASSTVLAAFMGGLALGAVGGGRIASRLTPREALRAYAGLELVAAVLAVALPYELGALSPILVATYQNGQGGLTFVAIRLVACLVLMLVPAMALGATFPMAVRWAASLTHRPAHLAGRLYAANTVGAAAGAVLAGFVLLPAIGVFATSLVGCAGSLIAASLSLVIAARPAVVESPQPVKAPASAPAQASKARRVRKSVERPVAQPISHPGLAGTILAVTGVVTFACELAWTRVFALIVGPSTYAFAATVAAFIGGLAIGACAGSAIGGRTRRLTMALGIVLGAAALATAWASSQVGGELPRRVMLDFASGRPGGLLLTHALLVAATIVPTAIGIGAAFPLALELAGGSEAPARRLGGLYAINTVAAVSGSLLTGFFAIPLVGLERTLGGAIVLLIVAACVALWQAADSMFSRIVAGSPAVLALVLLATGGPWDRELLTSGSYKYASAVPTGVDVETALKAGTLVFYRDGPTGTVSVKRLTGALSLAIDGKVDASTAGDMLTQKLLAHLPLLLHDDPHEVCIIGLGSGVTLLASLTHPIAAVDVLEISPEVAEASRLFTDAQHSPLDDPRSHLIVADGRTHLALSRKRYDVIISEPSNPWMAGVAALFTREFFEAAKARLEAHGIICQWVNTYDISTEDLQSVVATFASVFPHRAMWLIGDGDLLLIGSEDPIEPRLDTLTTAWQRPGVAADLETVGVAEPFAILSMFLTGDEGAARFGANVPLQSDDRMALEFSGPRALRTTIRRDNVARLRSIAASSPRPEPVARAWATVGSDALAARATMLEQAGAFEPAYEAAVEAVNRNPGDARALASVVESAVAIGRQAQTVALLKGIIERDSALIAPRVALSRLHAATGALDEAVRTAAEAVERAPGDAPALEQLASLYADTGDGGRLAPVVARLASHADRAGSHYFAAALQFLEGDLESATMAARAALAIDPRHGKAQNLMGAIQATKGDTSAARTAFNAALTLDPRDPITYQNLALLELNTGNAAAAARLYAEALSLDPASETARQGLARAQGPR
jgi:spermidine synthase